MYLSRLILNPRHRRVQKEIADPYQMHRSLMRAFPDNLAKGAERVLFRLDSDSRTGALTLLVQSWDAPNWSWLDEPGARGYLLRPPETKAFDLQLAPGQVLAFRLRANPTVKHKVEVNGELKPKRHGLCREDDQRAWLGRKAAEGGFRVLTVAISREGNVTGWAKQDNVETDSCVETSPRQRRKLTFLAVQFDGLLQVTDPYRLRETVQQGIGSGKALGFGLLSLARPPA